MFSIVFEFMRERERWNEKYSPTSKTIFLPQIETADADAEEEEEEVIDRSMNMVDSFSFI